MRRVAVVGCGAVGSFYGARLWCAGVPVHFLLRSDYAVVDRHGVRILSPEGDFEAFPALARDPAEIGPCDLVIIALKTTANHLFPALLPPLVNSHTWVLTLQNGLGNEEALASLFGPERVLGGLCFVCLNRVAPGVIRHTAHGAIVLGQHASAPSGGARAVAELLGRAGIPCDLTPDLAQAHWEKLIWNIPFNGLGVAGIVGCDPLCAGHVPPGLERTTTLPTDELLGDARWARVVRELMDELVAAGRAAGFPIAPTLPDQMIERTRCMGAYRASTLLDFEQRRPLELQSLFLEPLRRAEAARVPTPRLRALCAVLSELDRRLDPGKRLLP
jgi:2-dehydropantoate 2-reductase